MLEEEADTTVDEVLVELVACRCREDVRVMRNRQMRESLAIMMRKKVLALAQLIKYIEDIVKINQSRLSNLWPRSPSKAEARS